LGVNNRIKLLVARVDVSGAVWNYKLLTHNNNPAHNMKYLVALAQLSIEKLAGE
jgi:hypothetical protein